MFLVMLRNIVFSQNLEKCKKGSKIVLEKCTKTLDFTLEKCQNNFKTILEKCKITLFEKFV